MVRTPDALCVAFKKQRLTYRELNERANQVAHYLRKRGVGPEILVGICLERSLELVIALLAVWKAGGAYVPLDPQYPRERLTFIARDARVKVLLTGETFRKLVGSAHHAEICLDSGRTTIYKESTSNPQAGTLPSNLAYVMYTSGSTGKPKGAMIEHRGLVNYLCWAIKAYATEGPGSVPLHTSIAFDSTVASLFPPLLAGGQIEILPEEAGAQSLLAALRKAKNRSKVVVTPAHLELLNLQLDPAEMAGMTKVLVVAGEALRADTLSKWREHAPETLLFNEYGPTEGTVGCCAYAVQANDSQHGPVPIGSPIANAQLYVLDHLLQPVPRGSVGELYIGGAGVARGYLHRPELTRDKFLDDPFSGRSGGRLYKTGDMVRYRKDGTLEFCGRIDDQVKIRGHRIELGEIESTVASYPGIRSCIVLAHDDAPGNKQLVSYIVANESASIEGEQLRQFLRQMLPDHMIPAHFVFLDSFPLSPNGKIDRQSLRVPTSKQRFSSREFVAPQTETEKKLAVIFTEQLAVDRIGIHDDFFELGGNSLSAIKVLSRIEKEFGKLLGMTSLFPSATIAELAKALAAIEEPGGQLTYAVAVQPTGKNPALWLATGNISIRPLLLQLGNDQPFYSMGLRPGCIDVRSNSVQLENLVGQMVSEIREKQPAGPYYLGGFCRHGVFAYEVARQLMTQGHEVGLLVLFEPFKPGQNARSRIVNEWRRLTFRTRFRFRELRRLGIREVTLRAQPMARFQDDFGRDSVAKLCAVQRSQEPVSFGQLGAGAFRRNQFLQTETACVPHGDISLQRLADAVCGRSIFRLA